MKQGRLSDEDDFDEVLAYANELHRSKNMTLKEVKNTLTEQGLSEKSADYVILKLQSPVEQSKREAENSDILWGAIVFGAIQLFKGLTNQDNR